MQKLHQLAIDGMMEVYFVDSFVQSCTLVHGAIRPVND
jgi:hypothetical protein